VSSDAPIYSPAPNQAVRLANTAVLSITKQRAADLPRMYSDLMGAASLQLPLDKRSCPMGQLPKHPASTGGVTSGCHALRGQLLRPQIHATETHRQAKERRCAWRPHTRTRVSPVCANSFFASARAESNRSHS
jgi:hypothetical protein